MYGRRTRRLFCRAAPEIVDGVGDAVDGVLSVFGGMLPDPFNDLAGDRRIVLILGQANVLGVECDDIFDGAYHVLLAHVLLALAEGQELIRSGVKDIRGSPAAKWC